MADDLKDLNDALYDICRQDEISEILEDKYIHLNYALDSSADNGFNKFILDIARDVYVFKYEEFLDMINRIYEKGESGINYLNQLILYYPNESHLARAFVHTFDKLIEIHYPLYYLISWIQRIQQQPIISEMLLTLLAVHPQGYEILMSNEFAVPNFHPYAMITALAYENDQFVNLLINTYDSADIRKSLLMAIEIKKLQSDLIPIDYHIFQQALWTGNESYLQKFIFKNHQYYLPMLASSLSVFGYISLIENIYPSIDPASEDFPKYICRCNTQKDRDAAERLIANHNFHYVYSSSPIFMKNNKLNSLYEEWKKNNKILKYYFGHILFANLSENENISYLLDGFYFD